MLIRRSVDARPIVVNEDGVWIVRFERSGRVQEYRCATEAQARSLERVLLGGPS